MCGSMQFVEIMTVVYAPLHCASESERARAMEEMRSAIMHCPTLRLSEIRGKQQVASVQFSK
eukprot:3804912-Pyramimonas_sp.AAC.1